MSPSSDCLLIAFCRALMLVLFVTHISVADEAMDDEVKGDAANGKRIYVSQCASCHGDRGQGSAEYESPLAGKRNIATLAKIISETMPADNPNHCVEEDAQDVAQYIYLEFYASEARHNASKARVELVRLTANQHRSVIADLMGDAVVGRISSSGEQGLKAKYYNARNPNKEKLAFERTDANIDFDFGNATPDAERMESEEFSIFWEGGLRVRETGEYEIIVKTKNGFNFWLNDKFRPAIDGWVADGIRTEHRIRAYLMGGRVYPLKLLLFRLAGDSCGVSLEWIPPGGTRQIISPDNLVPDWSPIVGTVPDFFPPDDSSVGYGRGTQVSRGWDEATTLAAVEFADQVVELLSNHVRHADASDEQERAYKDTLAKLLKFAFRRPLTAADKDFFLDRQFRIADNPATAVRRALILALKSPRFLYLNFGKVNPDQFDVASRLSFALWDSGPDQILMKAAESGESADGRAGPKSSHSDGAGSAVSRESSPVL